MPWSPTDAQILDCDGVYLRTDRWRFDLADQAGNIIGELHPDAERNPTLANNTSGQIPRTLDGFILPVHESNDINPLTDRCIPTVVLQNGSEYQMGVMMGTDDNNPLRPWGTEHNAQLGDQSVILNAGIEHSIGFGKGADIGLAVLGVALEVFTPDQIEIDPISATLGTGVNHPPGTSRRTILDDFMAQIGFLPTHFSRAGKLRIKDVPDLTTASPSLIYGPGTHIISGSVVASNDSLKAPNVFLSYDTSGTAGIVGRYEISALSPHSEPNIGFFRPLAKGTTGLATQAAADKAAKSLAATEGVTYRWMNFATTLDPRHDTWDPIHTFGLPVDAPEDVNWLETQWAAPCITGGVMTHTLRAVF